MAFFVPPYAVDMTDLAVARGVEPAKFHIGLGQDKMAVTPSTQDIVTLAANAAAAILTDEDHAAVEMIIVGTESSVDESKAASVILHGLLDIQPFARAIEIKEACYGATSGILMARDYVASHPEAKVLVIASDIARYGLGSSGEPTQGAGAVAMLITAEPRIFALDKDSVALTQDIYDFWRPTGESFPRVEGKLSNETYIKAFAQVWEEYQRRTGATFEDFAAFAFHTPYTKMGKKALLPLIEGTSDEERLLTEYESSIVYNRQVGNLYTGSLWLSFISLLENSQNLSAGDKIGLFSYGSGTVAEFFTGELQASHASQLRRTENAQLLADRKILSIPEYEEMFTNTELTADSTPFSLIDAADGKRKYSKK